ncbi:hypothetical protein [Pseudanabaena sp. 'Roaring Creek']|uniref:hypothetical protein n=1 Tax=Pseudanabaena sp. 'Roaring Creek' TaxID=1681830 RepID=UPI0006D7AB95|nr:hypothetical protein [Pseudanabaena sp. 'Roaring Creek']
MKYCQLAIFPELETVVEVEPKVTLETARRSINSQLRSLSKYYDVPEYLVHLAYVTDYLEKLKRVELLMYVTLFISQITVVPEDWEEE